MSIIVGPKKDLSHRLFEWVGDHQRELILVLVVGLGFFGAIAGWLSWQQRGATKAEVALYEAQNKKEALEQVAKNFPHTKAAVIALSDLGALARDAAQFDDCIRHFQTSYEAAGHETYFRVLSLQGIGICYRAKGDYKKSVEFFDRAAKEPGNKAPLVSRFEAIRSHQFDKDSQTESLYQSLLAEKNLPPELKTKIEEQLSWLKQQKGS